MASDKVYVVFVGRVPGIYHTWEECQMQVHNFKGNSYKSFKTYAEAKNAYILYPGQWNRVKETTVETATIVKEELLQSSSTNKQVHPNPASNVVWINGFLFGIIVGSIITAVIVRLLF